MITNMNIFISSATKFIKSEAAEQQVEGQWQRDALLDDLIPFEDSSHRVDLLSICTLGLSGVLNLLAESIYTPPIPKGGDVSCLR